MRQSFCYDKMCIFHSEAVTHSAFAIYLPSKQMLSDQINSHSFGAPLVNVSGSILLTVSRRCFVCGSFLLLMFHVCLCYAVLSVPCSMLLPAGKGLLCVVFSCVVRCGIFNQ